MGNPRFARLAALAFLALVQAFEGSGASPAPPWPASSPSREGLSPAILLDMLTWMRGSGLEFRSLAIVKNGKLAASVGFDPFEPGTPQNVYSCAKGFLSTLVGIARAEGRFPRLDSTVSRYLGQYDFGKPGDSRRRITFEHLLTQSSGYPPVYSWDFERVFDAEAYVINKGLVAEPGKAFLYNSGTLNVLSAALQKAVGMKASDYAGAKLLGPLGIRDWTWTADGAGVTTGGTDLCVSCLDLAKLGYLYLRGGDWFGKRVVPAEWVAEATRPRFEPRGMNRAEDCGYGYLWWIDEWGGFSAHGSGGQFCFVVPSLDMVVAFTSSLDLERFPLPYDLMRRYILPAAEAGEGSGPDPEGDAAFAALASSLAARERPAAPLPATAASVAGVEFRCEKNPLSLDCFRIDFPEAGRARVTMTDAGGGAVPRSFDSGMRGRLAVSLAGGGFLASEAEWTGERSLRLLVFDMSALMEFAVEFDEAGGAAIRARSATYGIDASWRAARR